MGEGGGATGKMKQMHSVLILRRGAVINVKEKVNIHSLPANRAYVHGKHHIYTDS